MYLQYFTFNQILPFIISAVILIASIITFHLDKKRIGLFLLFAGSIGIGFFIANLDHFIILWDEQFHALVAKNMLNNPLKPTLYSLPVLDYDYRNWSCNNIWLHKQPLFLWQIALSFKLFGVNELALRMPCILLHAIAVLMVYRIGKLTQNATIGFYGALFFAVAYYPLELIAGKFSTDHNDFAFLFYITASFWAWFEYQNSNKSYWLIIIGVFAGCAVLVKWLVGLLIYAIWIISLGVDNKKNWLRLKSYIPVLISFAISLLIFIPWQLYILSKYPLEAKFEFHYNSEHIFKAVEGHGGNFWFHFNVIKDIYGSGTFIPYILLIGIFLLLKNSAIKIYRVAIVSAIIITYGFFSLAATKMNSFCIIVSPFVYLGLASLTYSSINFINNKIRLIKVKFLFTNIALIAISFFILNMLDIAKHHTHWKPLENSYRQGDIDEMKFIKKLPEILYNEKYVVFNTILREHGNIPVMFYTNYIAYDFIPTKEQIEKIRQQSYKIAILDLGNLPDFILNDKEIIKINKE